MKYRLKLTPAAYSDIRKGFDYYNSQQKGLGQRFASVIKDTLANIKKMPFSASVAYDDIRYKVIDKFPYVILYTIQGNFVSVLRVFNTYQKAER